MEVGVTATPVTDLSEWVRGQDVFGVRVYQVDSVLVDGYQDVLRELWLRGLFHFEEGGTERRPLRNHLEKRNFSVISVPRGPLMVRADLSLPLVRGDRGEEIDWHELVQRLRELREPFGILSELDPIYESS